MLKSSTIYDNVFPLCVVGALNLAFIHTRRKGRGFNSSLYKKYYACVLTYYFWWYEIPCNIFFARAISLRRKMIQYCFLTILYTNLNGKICRLHSLKLFCYDANAILHSWTNIHWSFGTVLTGFPMRHLDRTFKFSSSSPASSLINHIQLLKRWEKEG